MKRIFLLMTIAASMFIASCNMFSPYGKKVKINDMLEVYIKGDSTTETDAQKLGNFIAETWKDSKNQKSFQLVKDKSLYTVKMVVDETKFKADSSLDMSFMAIRMLIETQVFIGSKVKLVLTDNKFKDIKAYESVDEAPSTEEKKDSSATK